MTDRNPEPADTSNQNAELSDAARNLVKNLIVDSPGKPMANGRKWLEASASEGGVYVRRYHRGSFYLWEGTHWATTGSEAVEAEVAEFFEFATYYKPGRNGGPGDFVDFDPTNTKMRDLLGALRNITYTSATINSPAWVENGVEVDGLAASDILPLGNGLLYTPTRKLLRHTPRFFNTYVLPFDYDPAAPQPHRWLQFLEETHPNDDESVATLQEMIGYLLTPDNRHQMMFHLMGASRSGKGTTARLLGQLVGRSNIGAASLSSLGGEFGLESIADKPVVILGDVKVTGQDSGRAVERLLSITGDDDVPVNPKGRKQYTARLPCRFVMVANALPVLRDDAQALRNRTILITFKESFVGREDRDLDEKLNAELPGIMNWALEGLDRLRSRGEFIQPRASLDDLAQLAELTAPEMVFAQECCVIDPAAKEANGDLYAAWTSWCGRRGTKPGNAAWFGRNLRTALPKLGAGKTNRDANGQQQSATVGLALTPGARADYLNTWRP